jgi:hypothetical protein
MYVNRTIKYWLCHFRAKIILRKYLTAKTWEAGMPRKKKHVMTKAKLERYRKEGRGQGEKEAYKPWIQVQDFPSKGNRPRIMGILVVRPYHFMSDFEGDYFNLLQWFDAIIEDIQEQFPLDVAETMAIAEQLGIPHPQDDESGEYIHLTEDFLITLRIGMVTIKLARSLKTIADLEKKRTLEKLEIHRLYWKRREIDWGIVTKQDLPEELIKNTGFILDYYSIEERGISSEQVHLISALLTKEIIEQPTQALSDLASAIDKAQEFEPGTSLTVAFHLLAIKKWLIDISLPFHQNEPLNLTGIATDLPNSESNQ